MKKISLVFLTLSLAWLSSSSQCLIPRGSGDSVTPVTGNFLYDSSVGWNANNNFRLNNVARTGNQYYVSGGFTNIGPCHGSGVVVDSISKALGTSLAWKINGFVRTSVPDGQGGFYIGGDFTQIGDSGRSHIAQIDATGRPSAWNPGADHAVNVLYKRNDTLFVGGVFYLIAHQNRHCFAALSLSGDTLLPYRLPLDSSLPEASVYALKPHGNGKLFIGGNQLYFLGGVLSNIIDYDINRVIITTWTPQFREFGYVQTIDLSQDGQTVVYTDEQSKYLFADDVSTGNQLYRISFASLVGGDNSGLPESIKTVGNNLYIAGAFDQVTDASGIKSDRNGLCSINISNGLLQNFNLNLNTSFAEYVDAYNGNLVVSGPFTQAGGSAREHFVMVDTGTFAINAWNPSPSDPIRTISFSGGHIFLGGLFNGIQSVHRNGVAGFDGITGAILPFNPPPNPAVTATKRMVIRGDTMFLLGHTERLNGSGTEQTMFMLYRLSTGAVIASPLANTPSIHDILFDQNYMYVTDDFTVKRFGLPGLSQDATWGANYFSGVGPHVPQVLCVDSNNIYSVGDDRIESLANLEPINYTCLSRINKANSSTITTWSYIDTIKPYSWYSPTFSHAVLADSIIFVQGGFNSLNGKTVAGAAAINVKNGNLVNWSPPFTLLTKAPWYTPLNDINKLLLRQGAIWFGIDYINGPFDPDPSNPIFFAALDSSSGQVLPSPILFRGKSDAYVVGNSPNTGASVNDFLFDADYCTVVGSFGTVNGQMHQCIVRLSYGPYSPPPAQLTINGPDTIIVAAISDTISYSLPDSMTYTWKYSGTNTTILNSGQNPAMVAFSSIATGGVLSATGTGYCGTANNTAQKNIVVIHVLPKPTANACCMTFTNIQPDRMSLAFTPGNGSGRLVVASTSPVVAIPAGATVYAADPNFGSGADLGGGNFVVYSGTGNTLTVTGLQPSTRYYFTVFEYDGSSNTLSYLTTQAYANYDSTLPTAQLPTAVVNLQDPGLLINVFPNPVQQHCYVRVQSNELVDMAIKVFDVSGKQVNSYSHRIYAGLNNFELEDFERLAKGVYILYLKVGNHEGSIELFKE